MLIFRLTFVKFLFLLVPFCSYALEVPVSSARSVDQSWQAALSEQYEIRGLPSGSTHNIDSQSDHSILIVSPIPQWNLGIEALNTFTVLARTSRRYQNPNSGSFQRRAPWYFPTDGCYAKAAHVSSVAKAKGYLRPGKIFAYGDLEFNSSYSKDRKVTYWSYHVAAAYRIGSTVYVIDPMVNPNRAITSAEWVSRISPNPGAVKIALCDGNAYSPYSRCRGGKGNGAYTGHVLEILKQEWNHLIYLGISPVSLLGPAAL